MYKPASSHISIIFLGLIICQSIGAVEWSVDINPIPHAGSRPNEFGLRGVWPNSCVPETVSVKTEPEDKSSNLVYLQTSSEQLQCQAKPTPFILLFSLPANTSTTPELYWLHQDALDQPARLLGFKLMALSSGQPDIRPASGWWWPEPGEVQNSGPGTGLTVDYQNGLLTLLTENFRADGQPEWLLGTAPMKRGVLLPFLQNSLPVYWLARCQYNVTECGAR